MVPEKTPHSLSLDVRKKPESETETKRACACVCGSLLAAAVSLGVFWSRRESVGRRFETAQQRNSNSARYVITGVYRVYR